MLITLDQLKTSFQKTKKYIDDSLSAFVAGFRNNIDEIQNDISTVSAECDGLADDVTSLRSDLSDIENVSYHPMLSGTYSGVEYVDININLGIGTYIVDVDSVESSDTDESVCEMRFYSNGVVQSIYLKRGSNIQAKFRIPSTSDIYKIRIYASKNATSSNDTLTLTGFKIYKYYQLKDDIMRTRNLATNLIGSVSIYSPGERVYKKNYYTSYNAERFRSVYSPGHDTYEYTIDRPTAFKVTGKIRTESNYLAICTDDDNNILQLINQGMYGADIQYTDYIFAVDAIGVTKVYICLLSSEDNDVQIGIIPDSFVTSFNGSTGDVTYTAPVTSVAGKTGAVTLTASDVGALSSDTVIPSKTSDLTNDSDFITSATVPTATASKSGTTTTLTVTDKNGTTTAQILDGVQGAQGAKGDKGDTGDSGVYIGDTAPTGDETVWIDTSGDSDTDSQGIASLQTNINYIKNLQAPAIISDTYSGTTLSTISVDIAAGTYSIEIDKLTSSDTDSEISLITFIYSDSGSLSIRLPRGVNIKRKVKFINNVTTMYLYASDNYSHSNGDTFSYTGFKIITPYPLKNEVDEISQSLQGLSGSYFTYEEGSRTFNDNILAYIYNNMIVLADNAPAYATYVYKITKPTSFNVTGSTRGASNYLAIATDDSGNCVQTIEQGISATTKSYNNFEFLIDDPSATTVYICLYKSSVDDVRIGIDKNVKELSILFIGNSLTQDGISYLPYLLTKYYPEFKFRFYMWYNGGYDLSQQYAKFIADTACEAFSIAENTPVWTTTTAKMSDILSTYRFNIVCIQEYFNRKESYTSVADWNSCRDYIMSHYTGGNGLEFISLFHSPWLTNQQTVYELTKTGNALILQNTIADDMIATGIALYIARDTDLDELGDQGHLTPDSVHAQEGLPCLLETYTALLWVLDRYNFPTSIYGLPFKMTAGIQSSIAVPGANIGTGVIEGTDAQNLLAQEVAIKAYKIGKKFVADNLAN